MPMSVYSTTAVTTGLFLTPWLCALASSKGTQPSPCVGFAGSAMSPSQEEKLNDCHSRPVTRSSSSTGGRIIPSNMPGIFAEEAINSTSPQVNSARLFLDSI